MGKIINVVGAQDAILNWQDYSKLFEKALEYNHEGIDCSYILTGILLGKYKLVVGTLDNQLNGVSVLEMMDYPGCRVCNIAFVTSENMAPLWDEYVEFVCLYAKEYGAKSIQLHGRKGWKRVLANSGFKEIYTVLERKL